MRDTTPVTGGCTATLRGVTYVSSAEAYAVGDNGTILRCAASCSTSSATWASIASPTTDALDAVANGGSNTVLAVGVNGRVLKCTATCSTSTNWSITTRGTVTLTGVATSGTSFGYMVGLASGGHPVILGCSSNCYATLTNWNAVSWTPPTTQSLFALARAGTAYVAVGAGGSMEACTSCANLATVWGTDTSKTTSELHGVSITTSGNTWVYAVGDGGAIVGCENSSACSDSGTTETVLSSGTSSSLLGVTGTGSAAWAVGTSGTALKNGTSPWSTLPVG